MSSKPERVHLPVLPTETGSLRADGSHEWMHPADVHGPLHTRRKLLFAVLMAVYALVPWVPVRGHPAVLLDVEHRAFFFFGASFNAQDVWLLFFVITGVAFSVAYATMLVGRAWCGWACPQTVFLEGLYRPIERAINGPREARLRRAKKPWDADRVFRFVATQLAYIAVSVALAHGFAGYFVSYPRLLAFMREGPGAHGEAFAWVAGLSVIFFVNFGWFREQFCVGVCPYGRLQGVLTDADSISVGYDYVRGEPRGKASDKAKGAGDCVDCRRCVVVCPTGIDIRNGTQLDCVGCTACIDACNEVMQKLHRPKGLIRHDSLRGLAGEPRRIARPRLYLYSALGVVGLVVATLSMRSRSDFEATALRQPGMPYVLEDGAIRNSLTLRLVNKRSEAATLTLRASPAPGHAQDSVVLPFTEVRTQPMGTAEVPLFVRSSRALWRGGYELTVRVARAGAPPSEAREVRIPILGP